MIPRYSALMVNSNDLSERSLNLKGQFYHYDMTVKDNAREKFILYLENIETNLNLYDKERFTSVQSSNQLNDYLGRIGEVIVNLKDDFIATPDRIDQILHSFLNESQKFESDCANDIVNNYIPSSLDLYTAVRELDSQFSKLNDAKNPIMDFNKEVSSLSYLMYLSKDLEKINPLMRKVTDRLKLAVKNKGMSLTGLNKVLSVYAYSREGIYKALGAKLPINDQSFNLKSVCDNGTNHIICGRELKLARKKLNFLLDDISTFQPGKDVNKYLMFKINASSIRADLLSEVYINPTRMDEVKEFESQLLIIEQSLSSGEEFRAAEMNIEMEVEKSKDTTQKVKDDFNERLLYVRGAISVSEMRLKENSRVIKFDIENELKKSNTYDYSEPTPSLGM